MLNKIVFILAIALSVSFNGAYASPSPLNKNSSTIAKRDITITFNKRNLLVYHLNSGMLDVYCSGQRIFKNIYAAVKYDKDTVTTKTYALRTYHKSKIVDANGQGEKHVINLSGPNLIDLEQIIYVYKDKPYFFTELVLKGLGLKSNYMAPWIGNMAINPERLVAVTTPFDNDTFISYDAHFLDLISSSTSAEVGLILSKTNKAGLIAGSVEHGSWKTGVQFNHDQKLTDIQVWGGYTSKVLTRDTIAHGCLKGNTLKSPKIMIGYFDDWRMGMQAYGIANRIADPPFVAKWIRPTPVGWNSWGAIQENLSFEKALKVVDFFADSLKYFRTGNTAFIDLDSYWDKMLSNGDYSKLIEFANYCKSKGLQPGIYWAPFTDWGFKSGGMRKIEHSDYRYGDTWTAVGKGYHDIDGARAMDPTHPGTLQRIDYYTGLFQACGFKMIKIDFLGHAAVESSHFFDTTVTTGMQAYRKGMEYLISRLGGMFIYAAISPTLATGRYVNSRRIACDAFKTIEHTRYTLNSVTYGWWQSYLYDYLDADHVVFGHQTKGENRARFLSSVITGTLITGDDFSTPEIWSNRAKLWFQDPDFLDVVKAGKAFAPIEASIGKDAARVFSRQIGDYLYVAIFNYDEDAREMQIGIGALGLPSTHSAYQGVELFTTRKVSLKTKINVTLPGKDAAFYKIKVI